MRILHSFGIGLMRFLCVTAVALLVYLGTLQLTVLDRSAVKEWVDKGGVYENHLIPELIRTGSVPSGAANAADAQTFTVPPDALKQALERTFTPQYVKTHTEASLDAFYDWLEGITPHFKLSVPINEKRDEFINELVLASEPYVASLPLCVSAFPASLCRPPVIPPATFARELITQNISQSSFFDKPLTNSAFADQPSALPLPIVQIIPYTTEVMVALVIITITSAAIVAWLSRSGVRIKRLVDVAKRIFISQLFTFVAALFFIMLFYFNVLRFSSITPAASDTIAKTIGSSAKIAFLDMTTHLAVLSGIAGGVSLLIWVGGRYWLRKNTSNSML